MYVYVCLCPQTPDEAHVGEAFEAQVSFTNTLPVALTGCVLNVEGPGLQKPLSLPQAYVFITLIMCLIEPNSV